VVLEGAIAVPRIKGRCAQAGMKDGKLMALIECNEKAPRKGELVSLKWGSTRTLSQNRLYWKYLSWLIEHGGLKDHGHFDPQALHENLKAHFLSEKMMDKGEFKAIEEATTTDLGKCEFGEYFDKVNHFMIDFFNINPGPFWESYAEYKM
jgi:hypothetical protein